MLGPLKCALEHQVCEQYSYILFLMFCVYIFVDLVKRGAFTLVGEIRRYKCEQVLFVYVYTIIPPRLLDPCNFITVLLVTREPEQTTLLF